MNHHGNNFKKVTVKVAVWVFDFESNQDVMGDWSGKELKANGFKTVTEQNVKHLLRLDKSAWILVK